MMATALVSLAALLVLRRRLQAQAMLGARS
jgi:hypothetical protein